MKKKTVFLAGHNGMVGKAIEKQLKENKKFNLLKVSKKDADLRDQQSVKRLFEKNNIDYVIISAAKVGGIFSNSIYPKDFLLDNLQIQNNLIYHSYKNKIKRLIFLGSSCIYPKYSKQPIKENELLQGMLEPTNEPYAIAKIAGIKLCESFNKQHGTDFRSLMPCNIYGENDNFNLDDSHVIPALMKKFYNGQEKNTERVQVWGTGKPRREFMHVNDLANAVLFFLNLSKKKFFSRLQQNQSHINVGTGKDVSIKSIAKKLKTISKFSGKIEFDTSKPDGTPRKVLDISVARSYGWQPIVDLDDGLRSVYNWMQENIHDLRQ